MTLSVAALLLACSREEQRSSGPLRAGLPRATPKSAPDAATLAPNRVPDSTPLDAGAVAPTSLADLELDVVANGWGPLERNTSNGDIAANDGRAITLNGVVHAKGLGVHARSEVRIALGGRYRAFDSDVGIDDEVEEAGSVVFQVLADGVLLFDSGLMTGTSETKHVSVDVTGTQQLTLVVTDGGDDNTFDHADWASARLDP